MSDNSLPPAPHEGHIGPIKNPKQLLLAVFFSFVVPIFAIIGLVFYVVSEMKPAGSANAEHMELGGVTQQSHDQAIEQRIQKVGFVEIRDANRPLKTGEDVFKAQCSACHATGAAGSPKFGDSAAWGPRIKQGLEALVNSALHGKGAMPAQGGGDFDDTEVARAAAYMANAGGAKFAEPQRPAAAASGAAGAAPAADAASAPAAQTAAK